MNSGIDGGFSSHEVVSLPDYLPSAYLGVMHEEKELNEINTIGAGIMRPEGVVVQKDGTVLAADARGQIARISADGETSFYGDVGGTPNGICLDGEGNCIIANIGNGQVQSLGRDGTHRALMTEAEGKRIPPPTFPL